MRYLLAVIRRRTICLELRAAQWVEKETTDQVNIQQLSTNRNSPRQRFSSQQLPSVGFSNSKHDNCLQKPITA
ncbi:hypothetical protein Scep_025949 [Stephania cephalantha]|uniref:Uncharacterized protein n=1 Tax=Stephania cephalantha TaxID=152367 RepID=A0AAP0EJ66_9MAGN